MGRKVTDKQKEIISKNIAARIAPLSINPRFTELYFGSEEEMKKALDITIPGKLPDGRKNDAFAMFNKGATPAYLGMLAEIDAKPDVTLDELLDLDSIDAITNKGIASERLKSILPRQTENGVVYDHEKFKEFIVKNSAKLADKLDRMYESIKDKPAEEKQRFMKKYGVIIEGFFGGYNKTFMKPSVIGRSEARNNKEINRVNRKSFFHEKYKESISSRKALFGIYKNIKPGSKNSTKNLDRNFYFGIDSYAVRDELPSADDEDYEKKYLDFSKKLSLASGKARLDLNAGKAGLLGQLTDFERLVLATDPNFADRVKVSFVEGENGLDYRMTYTDNMGKTFSLQTEDKPGAYDMHNLAKLKTEIYDVVLNNNRYKDLEQEEKAEMQQFMGSNYAQKVAKLQCDDTKVLLDTFEQIVDKNKRKAAKYPGAFKTLYKGMTKNVTLLRESFDAVMKEPTAENKSKLDKLIGDTLQACDNHDKWIDDRENQEAVNNSQLNKDISEKLRTIVTIYKDKKDDLETTIALQAQAEEKKKIAQEIMDMQYNEKSFDLDYAALAINDFIMPLPKINGLTEQEYKAAIIGALLDEDTTGKIKVDWAEGELKNETTWSALLDELKNPLAEDNQYIGTALPEAKKNAKAAIDAFESGDRTKVDKYIKTFIDASIRMHDKNAIYGEKDLVTSFNRQMLDLSSELVKKDEYKDATRYVNALNVRKEVANNISNVIKAGEDSAMKVLNGELKNREERSAAVLNMLTSAYVKIKGDTEKETGKIATENLAQDIIAGKGIRVTKEMSKDPQIKDINYAIQALHNNAHYSDLEANFSNKKNSEEMIAHLHEKFKDTALYKSLMESDIALDNLASGGENAEILTGQFHDEISRIKFPKCSGDINNEKCEAEYKEAIENRWPDLGRTYARRQLVEDATKAEIAGRSELDYNKPLFGQYADNILESVNTHRNDYIKQGISADELKAFEENLKKYNSFVKDNFKDGEYKTNEIKAKADDMKQLLSEMETQYKNIFKAEKDQVDNPGELLKQDIKLLTDIAKMPENGSIEKLIRSNINEHTREKLWDIYADEVSNRSMRDKHAYNISAHIEELEKIKKDPKHPEEFKAVLRSAKYLKDVVSHIGSKDEVDVMDPKDFNDYKEALNLYSSKVNEYLDTLGPDGTKKRGVIESIKNSIQQETDKVNEMDKLFNGETYFDNKKKEELAAKMEADPDNNKVEEVSVEELLKKSDDERNTYFKELANNTNQAKTEFRKSAVDDLYDKTNNAFKFAKLSMADNQSIAKAEEFLEKYKYIALRLKKLQKPNKDGSYIKFSKELEDGLKKNLIELDKLAKGVGEALNKEQQVSKDVKDAFDKMTKNVSAAVKTDMEALENGVLYGSTSERYQKQHLKNIGDITNNLSKSKTFGDRSSDEFRDLLKDLSSLMKENSRKEYNQGTTKTFKNKLEKVSKSADEYLRHKRFNNNGSTRSAGRVQEVEKLKKYIDNILPAINKESETDSSKSRFEKMKYNKTKLRNADQIYDKIDQKRAQLDKLEDDPYKKISDLACDAREMLADYYFKGTLDKKLSENSQEYKDIQKCVATIALEKRIELERKQKNDGLNENESKLTRGMTTLFLDKLSSKDKDDYITVEDEKPQDNVAAEEGKKIPQGSKVSEQDRNYHDRGDLNDELAKINHGFVFNLLNAGEEDILEEAQKERLADIRKGKISTAQKEKPVQTHKENVYENMINQVVDYKLIGSDMLKADKVIGLLTNDQDATMDLYMNSLHGAVENSKQAKEAAAAKAAASKDASKEKEPQVEGRKLS